VIPFPTNASSNEALQGNPLVPQRISKKNNAKDFSSLISSLLEKPRTPKEGNAGAVHLSAGVKGAREPLVLRQPEDPKKEKAAGPQKSAGTAAKDAVADAAVRAKPRAETSVSAQAESKAPAGVSAAQPVSVKAVPVKDAKADDTETSPAEARSPAKQRGPELRKKDRLSDGQDASAEAISAASATAGAAAAAPQKAAAKADAAAKAEDGVEGVDGKKKDKRKDRLEIEVFDQRKGEAYGGSNAAARNAAQPEAGSNEGSGKNGADLVLTLRDGSAETNTDKADSARGAAGQKASFADALARELRESYNGDIVQRASVVLKDGGDGLVRLSLRPEALGSVKIKLELADNKIAGRILVETEEALKAFGKELRSLEQAFVDGGFDGASLELALSSGDSGAGSGRREQADAPRPFFSDRIVAAEYESTVPSADAARRSGGIREDSLIDMLA
jgi:flagellar hook-length control protein FliK